MPKKYRTRSDKGTRKSEWVEIPCQACGFLVSRRKSEVRTYVYCSRKCYYAHGASKAGKQGGRPRSVSFSKTVRTKREPLVAGESTKITNEGYVMVWMGTKVGPYGGWALQHRIVMEQKLGRPLQGKENVHHKNGVKDDNRPDNLELWVRSQPPGQRIEDINAWCINHLATYLPESLAPGMAQLVPTQTVEGVPGD